MNVTVEITTSLTANEIGQLTDLARESVGKNEGIGLDKEEVDTYYAKIARELVQGERLMAIARSGNAIVGSLIAKFYFADFARHLTYFEKLLVRPVFRRKGVSTQLIDSLESKVKVMGKERIELSFRKGNPVEHVYLKRGFRIWGIATKESKIGTQYFDEVYMEKLL